MKKEIYSKKQPTLRSLIFSAFRRKSLLLLAILSFPLFSMAQEKKVEETYLDYFSLPRESLFLHTNKTTFLVGEEIWFKIYAYDRKNEKSSKRTTNVYIGLYDNTGKQLNKKLILISDGTGTGSIPMDEKMASGDYYLKISTNWMKNFEENDAFAQKISVINPKIEAPTVKLISQKEYDIQFLPEGGHMVSDIRNVIGVKAIDDKGKGTKATGIIVDSNGDELAAFTTNHLGLGKFSFVPERGERYSAKIYLENSKEVTQKLPVTDNDGIAIHVDNLRDDKTIVSINTNDKSFERLKNQKFKLLLHKDGKIMTSTVNLSSTSEKVIISRENLFQGVNILTLFSEDNQPLVERMFFNPLDSHNYDVIAQKLRKEGDSIYYGFIPKGSIQGEVLNASISVLPSGTKSYAPEHNIISSIHLKPYLKGAIETPKYYFSDNSIKNAYELDVLLLAQGWSRYSWQNIFYNTPDPNFDFENGITVNGHINTDLENIEAMLMFPTDMNKSTFIKFDDNGKFHLKNFYPIKGEQIKMSYVNLKGEAKKPGLALSFLKRMDEDVLDINQFQSYESFYKYKNDIPDGFITPERELLDEIQLNAKLLQRKKARKYRLPFAGRLENITEDLYRRYTDVQEYLSSKGVWIPGPNQIGTLGLANAQFLANGPGIGMGNMGIGLNQLNPWGGGFNGFFIDNRPVPAYALLARPLSDFEDIYVWQQPRVLNPAFNTNMSAGGLLLQPRNFFPAEINMFGNGAWNITVRAYTRDKPVSRFDGLNLNQNFTKVEYGFEPEKQFYTPKYISYEIQSFRDYGVIHWEPNAKILNDQMIPIKMIDTGLEEIDFYIEGISSNGSVFSQVIKLDTSGKK